MEKVFGVKNQQKYIHIYMLYIYIYRLYKSVYTFIYASVSMYKQELVHKMYLIQKNCFLYNT